MSPTGSKRGLIVASPASGNGKTTVTLGLLRALTKAGVPVRGAKIGPDYIDPKFHAAACGNATECPNLDSWAMPADQLRRLATTQCPDNGLLIVEGAMGLFDGAATGANGPENAPGLAPGSTADVAALLGLPVVLAIDARGMAQSVAALASGFRDFHPQTPVAGLIFTKTGGARHAAMLRAALRPTDLPVLGCTPKRDDLAMPSRHLGLVQADEHEDLEDFIARAAEVVAATCDLPALRALARPLRPAVGPMPARLPPPGQTIAVARDVAFAFCYPHLLNQWLGQGAAIKPFSPLAGDPPAPDADCIYLPGGYPELHGGKLAANARFLDGLRGAAARGIPIHGECGGFMVLGRALTDADGAPHAMAGLLPVETSMLPRRLTLGYREIESHDGEPVWPGVARARGHEFHFAHVSAAGMAPNLYRLANAAGEDLGAIGYRAGPVTGSFAHVISGAE